MRHQRNWFFSCRYGTVSETDRLLVILVRSLTPLHAASLRLICSVVYCSHQQCIAVLLLSRAMYCGITLCYNDYIRYCIPSRQRLHLNNCSIEVVRRKQSMPVMLRYVMLCYVWYQCLAKNFKTFSLDYSQNEVAIYQVTH